MNPETDKNNPSVHPDEEEDMQAEYDFSGGVRGKYYEAYQRSPNIVVLDPDVAELFPDSAAVNEALRLLAKIAKSIKV